MVYHLSSPSLDIFVAAAAGGATATADLEPLPPGYVPVVLQSVR